MLKVNQIIDGFSNTEDSDKVNEYINKLLIELSASNKKFNFYISLLIIAIAMHFLFINGYLDNVSFKGLKVTNRLFVDTWDLIIPSFLYLTISVFGYMRIYQQGVLTALYYNFKPIEYETGVFRLLFPASIPYALDLIRRQNDISSKIVILFPSLFFALGSLWLPIHYIYFSYRTLFISYGSTSELIVSAILSFILLLVITDCFRPAL